MKKKKGKIQKNKKRNNDIADSTIMFKFDEDELNETKEYKASSKKKGKNREAKKSRRDRKKEKKDKKVKKKKRFKWLKRIILSLFILGILAVLVVAGIVIGILNSDKYKLSVEELTVINENGSVLDSEGNQIATITGSENRKLVSLENMPKQLPEAFIAIEDKRFYEHPGVDFKRTVYATMMYILNKGDSEAGGGSTITQQLIKNTKSDKADTGTAGIERKIREMARAYNVEKILSKTQILEAYLNRIPMGSTVYGVGMASEYYFSKPVGELDLAECAFLAGINHAPSLYNPFTGEENGDKIKSRTKEVLYQMKDQEKITEEEYNEAVAKVEAGFEFKRGAIVSQADYSYHTQATIKQVIEDLMEQKQITRDEARLMIESNGYTIHSTQDSTIQARMQQEFLEDKYIRSGKETKEDGTPLNDHTQAAMVIMDHTTGRVLATMGGLGSDASTVGLNRATEATKQTGSSIKPLACEAPALENGIITAGTVYDDSYTEFGGNYHPHNSDYSYHGLITIREALAQSSNIVHLKIMKEVGPATSRRFLSTLGLNIAEQHESISMALGTADLSVLAMTGAYAAIANNGVYIKPTFYTKVVDAKGNVVLEPKQEPTRVMSEENAYVLQDLLKSPARSGTASVCYMKDQDVGAKTGSTDHYIDRWLCGFTPYYTAAVWFGFDYSERPVYSGNNAANIWAAVMHDIHSELPTRRFEKPSNVVSVRICKDSGCVATSSCEDTMSEVFVKGTIPKQCQGHTKLTICKETGKIANEYCKDTEETLYTKKPEKEQTTLWSTSAGDKYNVPTEVCDVHKIQTVKMVDVIGNTLADAKNKIEALGLKVEVKYSEDKNKKDGVVLTQSAKKDEQLEKGKTVTLTVNKIQATKTNTVTEQKTNTVTTPPTNTVEQKTNTTKENTKTNETSTPTNSNSNNTVN